MSKKFMYISLGFLLILSFYPAFSSLSMIGEEENINQIAPKKGYMVEFRFGDPKNVPPITKSLKIEKFSFDKTNILETTHDEGDIIKPYQIFKIKLDFQDNENYISPSQISAFINDKMLEEEYKQLFNEIVFEVENEKMIFRWAPQSQSCLYYSSPLEHFSWGAFEKPGYRKKDKSTGLHLNTVECGFYER